MFPREDDPSCLCVHTTTIHHRIKAPMVIFKTYKNRLNLNIATNTSIWAWGKMATYPISHVLRLYGYNNVIFFFTSWTFHMLFLRLCILKIRLGQPMLHDIACTGVLLLKTELSNCQNHENYHSIKSHIPKKAWKFLST